MRYPLPPLRATLDAGIAARLPETAGRLVALAPGGARNAARDTPLRRWPLDRYVTLARLLVDRGCTVVLTGSAEDEWVRPAFAGAAVVDLVGATTLVGLCALNGRCATVVTHDSGPLHLARLAGAAVIGLFGPTQPSAFLRESPRATALWPGVALPCAPCYDGFDFAACSDNRCMKLIDPVDVAARIGAWLE